MNLIPYIQKEEPHVPLNPNIIQGIFIVSRIELNIVHKIKHSFANRPDVILVDTGTTDKKHYQFVQLEWTRCTIDGLLLAILDEEPLVEDYTVYGRTI